MDWNKIWNSIVDFFTNNFWGIVKFFAVFLIGLIVIKLFLNLCRRVMARTKMEKVTQSFLYNIFKFCVYLAFIVVLLGMIGLSMSGVLTAISACILAVGMALQGIIANLANGIVLVVSHVVKKGDFISINGNEGCVEDVNFLFTTITTTDNKRITIPNSDLVNNAVTNYGSNETRRVDFTFSVAYESDVELVKKVILDVMHSNGNVRLDVKDPFCRLKVLNSSSIDFFANCWVDKEDYWDVYYYVVENVYNEFKRNNISVPYNQLEIRERKDVVKMPVNPEKLPERHEKERKQEKKHLDLEKDNLLQVFKKKKKDK